MQLIKQNNIWRDCTPSPHKRKQVTARPYTLVVDGLDLQTLAQMTLNAISLGIEIPIEIGLAVTNPADQFCRKTGLKTAKENMRLVYVKLNEVEITAGYGYQYYFDLDRFAFRVTCDKDGKKGHIDFMHFEQALEIYKHIYGE